MVKGIHTEEEEEVGGEREDIPGAKSEPSEKPPQNSRL